MSLEDTIEISEHSQSLSEIDQQDTRVKKSVVAYLMWHSGEVLSKAKYPSREDRANRIDELGLEAIDRSTFAEEVLADERRVLAAQSIFTQASESRRVHPQQVVCHLDSDMIRSGAMIPQFNLAGDDYTFETPEELQEMGFRFRDFDEFIKYYENFGTYLLTDPVTVMHMLEHLQSQFLHLAITNYRQLSTFHTIAPHWNVVGVCDDYIRTFENIGRTYDAGKTVRLRGQVAEVADGMVCYTKIAFRCRTHKKSNGEVQDERCNTINLVPQNPEEGVVRKPHECVACKGKDFVKMDSDKSRIEPVQRIQLQEIDISEDPKAIMIEFRGNLVGTVTAGSTIEVTGILRLDAMSKGSLMNTPYILASSLRVVSQETFSISVSDERYEEVLAYRDQRPFEERMVHMYDSWIGHLKCEPWLKAGMLLQAFGAPKETQFGHRSGIHILIAGDPGTAKSHLLKAMAKLLPGSRYVSADNTTQAGLTGACSQVEDLYSGKKRWAIVPGALALTPKDAVACVDEFNLYKGDFGDFNNAMESGFTTINKIVKGTVNTECSVLAGANPNAGSRKRFVEGQDYIGQLGLDLTVVQRFDAIFVLLDHAIEDNDLAIAMSMLGYGDSVDDQLDIDFIRSYISVGKDFDPTLTEEAARYMAAEHVKKRQQKKSSDYMRSHRQLASLKRFSLAAARFDLSDSVTIDHVKFAEKILAETINEKDPGQMEGAGSKESRELRQHFAAKLLEIMHEKNVLDNIDAAFVYQWMEEADFKIDKNTVKRYLDEFAKNSSITNFKRNDGRYSYDGPRTSNTLQHW